MAGGYVSSPPSCPIPLCRGCVGCPAARWGWPGRARGAEEGSAAPKGLLRVCGCLGGFAAGSTLLVAKKTSLKDPVSPLCTGALPLGALSQGEVLRCTAELGICTTGALLGPTVVLLERVTLKLLTGFSYHGPRHRFHGCSQLGGQGASAQGCWRGAEQPTAPERHLRTRLFNSRRSSVRSSEIGPSRGFILFSFPLPPARGCAKIPRCSVISLKLRGA